MDLIEHMRDYLIAQDIVRKPVTAGANPPMWLQPRDGVPAPGEGQNASERGATMVVGAYLTGGIPSQPYESFRRFDTVDIWYRTTSAKLATAMYHAMRPLLIDKRAWTMGALTIIESLEFRALQPLGSDAQAFDFVWTVLFERYAADTP